MLGGRTRRDRLESKGHFPSRGTIQLSYAFLASGAEFTPDGRLWTIGADVDTIGAAGFPLVLPAMNLVVKLTVQPLEAERQHTPPVEVVDSDGVAISDPLTIESWRQRTNSIPTGLSGWD